MHTVKRIDYKGAARRHFKDAELLRLQGRSENAGQLYGFNAECGLKAILVALGAKVSPDGDISFPYRQHVSTLINDLSLALTTLPNARAASPYAAHLINLQDFQDWNVDHRYWNTSFVPVSSLPKWQKAAQDIEAMLDAATSDGLI
jgi:hypothetical protein